MADRLKLKFGQLKIRYERLSENSRNVIWNVFAAFLVKGAALVLSLFTVPAYMRYFQNQTVLGVWFTIVSVLSWILNFDIGIGNGLRNHVARTLASGEQAETRKYISAAYVFSGVPIAAIVGLFCLLYRQIDWNAVFHIEKSVIPMAVLNSVVLITFIGIMGQLFLKLIMSILYAMQKSAINNLLNLMTSAIVYFYVRFAPAYELDRGMVVLAWVNALAIALPLIVVTAIVFSTSMRFARPSLKCLHISHARQVLSLGGIFFIIQIVYMFIMSTNEYFIAALSGSEDVVEYQIYARLFVMGSTIFALALTPVWSMVTRTLAQKNYAWVQNLYRRLLMLGGIGCLMELMLVPLLQVFFNVWLKERAIAANPWYGLVFATVGSLMIMNSILTSIANGAGELKTQAIFFSIGAVAKIPLAIALVYTLHSWIGVVIANVVAMGIYCVAQPFWLRKHLAYNLAKGGDEAPVPNPAGGTISPDPGS